MLHHTLCSHNRADGRPTARRIYTWRYRQIKQQSKVDEQTDQRPSVQGFITRWHRARSAARGRSSGGAPGSTRRDRAGAVVRRRIQSSKQSIYSDRHSISIILSRATRALLRFPTIFKVFSEQEQNTREHDGEASEFPQEKPRAYLTLQRFHSRQLK